MIFAFNNKFYIQVDDVAMRSPLGLILANIFLSDHEQNWLNKCPVEFKPSFYRRYVDNICVHFESIEYANLFVNICPLDTRTFISLLNIKILAHFSFYTTKFVVKTVNLSLVFTENQHLVEFSPIMKVSSQHTKRTKEGTLMQITS